MGGFVRIEPTTGNLRWEREDLDPVKLQYAKKYLAIEGFIEQAIGALDPAPDSEVKAMLDSIVSLGSPLWAPIFFQFFRACDRLAVFQHPGEFVTRQGARDDH
jgi:hypothetical protein